MLIRFGFMENRIFPSGGLCFDYNVFGKPYLRNSDKFFNLSHAGQYIVAAVSSYEVGIDVERINYQINLSSFDRVLSQSEKDSLLAASTAQEAAVLFYQLWTLKESYIKFLGRSISNDISKYSFQIENDCINFPTDSRLEFSQFSADEDHVCSICSAKKVKLEIKKVTEKVLFESCIA
ncbi:hypothetical protein OfM1_14090 [Lactovum odontotermitis]